MNNLTIEELMEYKDSLCKELAEVYKSEKWYQTKRVKRTINIAKYALLTKLIEVNQIIKEKK